MNIVVGSAFRQSAWRIGQYLARVAKLREHAGPGHRVRVISAEGDSTDGTRAKLATEARAYGIDVEIVPCDHGQPWFGSTEAALRMVTMSKVGNAIFDAVRPEDDVLFYVESDLIWDAPTAGSLIDMALRQDEGFDVFSPLVFAGENFYDVWGFRGDDGARFGPFPPYHSLLKSHGLSSVSSVGSCLAMRGDVARRCRIRNDYCLVGWCEDARAQGFRIAVARDFRIAHP